MTKAEISPCTRADYIEFFGEEPQRSIKAYSVRWKGELVCIAGIAMDSRFAFSDMKPCDAPKITIYRTAKALIEKLKQEDLLAISSSGSEKFLTKLGFSPVKDGLFKWQH